MNLTRRDAWATVLMGAATAVMLAVTQGWGWPLLGSYRTGAIALGIIGQGMCVTGSRDVMTAKKAGAYVATMSTLGGVALILFIFALVTASEIAFVGLWGVILGMWVVTTVRHTIQPPQVTIPDASRAEGKEPALTHV